MLKKLFQNTFLLFCLTVVIVGISIYWDIGQHSWVWFQRSGTAITLLGGIMTYRSIVRDGIDGVGSGSASILKGTIAGYYEDGTVKVEYSKETQEYLTQTFSDKFSGFIGAWLIIVGTLVGGYGDLIGHFKK